jgi:hypothetical protein
MKTLRSVVWTIILVLSLSGIAGATSYTFQPTPSDLWDLDHWKYYTWGIDGTDLVGETIVRASLFFDDIRNWDDNPNNLYVHLLDSADVGVTIGTDNQEEGDNFAGQGVVLNHWQNLSSTPQDITYNFTPSQVTDLISYVADGNFGLGFDPDCHYYNNGITLTIETAVVPEPSTMLLISCGLIALAGLGRKRFGKQ